MQDQPTQSGPSQSSHELHQSTGESYIVRNSDHAHLRDSDTDRICTNAVGVGCNGIPEERSRDRESRTMRESLGRADQRVHTAVDGADRPLSHIPSVHGGQGVDTVGNAAAPVRVEWSC